MKKTKGKLALALFMSITMLCGCHREFSSPPSNNSSNVSDSYSDSNSSGNSDSNLNSDTDSNSFISSDSMPNSSSDNSGQNSQTPDIQENGTPVSVHGQLSVRGTNLVDKNGNPYQLRGMSTHGLTWFPDFVNEQAFLTLRDEWKTNVVRLAMYVDEWNNGQCYMNNKQGSRDMLEKGVDLCIKLDMYAIIDWHVLNPGDPMKYTNEAIEFFDSVSKKYADKPNIIYEICNEPNSGASWGGNVKPYAEKVIPVIKANDPDAVIIVGTPTWSQDIDQALSDRLNYDNIMYALHFYADTHRDDLRNRLKNCVNGGLPVFVSEFGCCDASGGGANNFSETTKWLDLLDELNISYCNWALANKNETCCAILSSSGANGGWTENQLSESGKWIRNRFMSY